MGYHSMNFRHFPNISQFPKIQTVKSLENSWGNSYLPCLEVISACRFTRGKRKIWLNIKKSRKIMKMIICKSFFAFYVFINN